VKKLYVGNLPYTSTEDEVKTLFSQHGTVQSVAIITDRETGRSRGFCFVEMSDDAQATAAMTSLNGQDFGGRKLLVNEARERAPRSSGGGYNNRGDRGGYSR